MVLKQNGSLCSLLLRLKLFFLRESEWKVKLFYMINMRNLRVGYRHLGRKEVRGRKGRGRGPRKEVGGPRRKSLLIQIPSCKDG